MKKTVHVFLTLVFSCFAAAILAAPAKLKTEKPDLDKIKADVLNPRSEFYYPKLEARYSRNDTTMTPEEFRHFYLGYMFQEDYDPYRESEFDKVLERYREMDASKYTPHQIDSIIVFSEKTLKDNPFDLRQMSVLVHASQEMGNAMKAKIWEYRLENILGAIKSTGSGEDIDNAFYVIYPMHEYNMIQLLGYEPTAVDFPADGIDYISVRPEANSKRKISKPVEGFYFNVDNLTRQYELKHPEEADDIPADLPAEAGEAAAEESATTILSPDEIPAE